MPIFPVHSKLQLTRPAAAALSGQRVVWLDGGAAQYVDQSDADQVSAAAGITDHAAAEGDGVRIVTSGPIAHDGWTWTPGQPLYVTGTGQLSHTAPATGAVRQIAVAETATQILVQLQPDIRR